MSKNRRIVCRDMIEYRHSYHCFLANNLPQYLPPPSNVPPPPPPPKVIVNSKSLTFDDLDLRPLNLDPKDWKKQDHYLLLGLQDKREKATPAEIKAAYRARVLEYHPDKLQQASVFSGKKKDESTNENIFKCIFHAHEILSDPEKRRHYDSVDVKSFDESIPAEDAVPPGDLDTFLKVYRPVFLRNSRFSKVVPVPDIGNAFSPRESVEAFYAFWSNFESWRTFDYLDEDESDSAENRADKRWMERKNKAARAKRKNDDNSRLRRLFEQAYKIDPRIVKIKEELRLKREAMKLEREMFLLKLAQEENREILEKQERERKEKEALMKAELEAKQKKQAIDNKFRQQKKAFKTILVDNLYFVTDKSNFMLINERSLLVEKLLLRLTNLEPILFELGRLVTSNETDKIFDWIKLEYEKANQGTTTPTTTVTTPSNPTSTFQPKSKPLSENLDPPPESTWTLSEVDTLINAVKLHPGGLRERWSKIAEWYNRTISHLDNSLPQRSVDQIIKRANEIKQTTEEGQGPVIVVPSDAQTDYRALQKKRDPRVDLPEPTIVYDSNLWDADQQKSLEKGLKTFKTDDPSRWEKIAELVGKPKKDCMLRAKEIAQSLKQKKNLP